MAPAALRSPPADWKRMLAEMAAAGIDVVEVPIDAVPTLPVSALREAAEGLGLTLSARTSANRAGLPASHAFGLARDLGCQWLVVDSIDAREHRRWHDAAQEAGVTLVLDAASLDAFITNRGVQAKLFVELGATNAPARSGSALLRAAGERLGCVRLVLPAADAGSASPSLEREWAAALAACAYAGPIICSSDAALQASRGGLTAARRLIRRAEKIEWELSFGVQTELVATPRPPEQDSAQADSAGWRSPGACIAPRKP